MYWHRWVGVWGVIAFGFEGGAGEGAVLGAPCCVRGCLGNGVRGGASGSLGGG